jgi:hypothetical protein
MSEISAYINDLFEKWSDMEDADKLVVGASGILIIGGALISLFTRNGSVFLGGAVVSILLIIIRYVTKDTDVSPTRKNLAAQQAPQKLSPYSTVTSSADFSYEKRRDADFTYGGGELGAPIGRMEDKGPVKTFNGLVTMEEARKYPLMHRHPEVDVRTEPLDDRIRWATTDPLGPYTGQTVTGFW